MFGVLRSAALDVFIIVSILQVVVNVLRNNIGRLFVICPILESLMFSAVSKAARPRNKFPRI